MILNTVEINDGPSYDTAPIFESLVGRCAFYVGVWSCHCVERGLFYELNVGKMKIEGWLEDEIRRGEAIEKIFFDNLDEAISTAQERVLNYVKNASLIP